MGIGTPFGGGGIVNERYCQVPEPTVVNGAWYVFEVPDSVKRQQISEGPDQFERNQSEKVTGEPNGVPQLKSAVVRPSMFCWGSAYEKVIADETNTFIEYLNPSW
jgi:hypothetical protein